ncbi:MAG: 4-deoxy-4-formamido-L-arabinose-phosphoundecaprenol deformylase [Deltaproteobacteria bacterium CG1_02_45_11]|nr:MAG: 4-deoxy-4-formamido-L-arabinose-phosphoundecaprenol deformylase [Deltaproteobacteria bacterium CG1_02_45_11]
MKIGLRLDVDTFRGTKCGVPNLCQVLADHSVLASFFFSVGPDNMGRHLWRLIRPSFLWKMLRTRALSLYGWDILLKGTFRPGPIIGEKLANIIHSAADAGHEVGLHAWDHYAWQTHIDTMTGSAVHLSLKKGVELLKQILGRSPVCSAAAGWRCNNLTLLEKAKFPFRYNSDCRGESLFYPLVEGTVLSQPQIPVTLPTYDEVIGRNGISNTNYNDYMLSLFKPGQLNVLTIHAEIEGMACLAMFDRFLKMAQSIGVSFIPLGTFLLEDTPAWQAVIAPRSVPGRAGWVSCQSTDRF